MQRLDKVVVPAGLIASAKTYSLILENEGLYVIHTGPATRDVRTRGVFQEMAVGALHTHYDKKIAEGEARITDTALSILAQEKHSVFLKLGEITLVKRELNWAGELFVYVTTPKKKYKFNMKNIAGEEVQILLDELKKRGVTVAE